jgi:hypothetical protein
MRGARQALAPGGTLLTVLFRQVAPVVRFSPEVASSPTPQRRQGVALGDELGGTPGSIVLAIGAVLDEVEKVDGSGRTFECDELQLLLVAGLEEPRNGLDELLQRRATLRARSLR